MGAIDPSDVVAAALGAYRTVPGIPDELRAADGGVRPVWQEFLGDFVRFAPAQVTARFALGDQHLADSGVYFRHVDGEGSRVRAWPLSHVPVLVAADEWAALVHALIQRANLLEAVACDVYGPNKLVAEGHLPPMLLARNPEWLRPMVGVRPRSGHFLHFVCFEVGRSPSGRWWVLGDRTQSPSGAGFAVENRVATSRMFSDFAVTARVQPLEPFYGRFRDGLFALRSPGSVPPAIFTPGPHADTYFEQAYISRCLGLSLLEGEDLVVERGRTMVRTVHGLRPIDVLWRRVDAQYADPLEFEEASRLGTPGLAGAVRQGGVTIVNALGSGVLETRALMAFLPRICRHLTGEPLALPNIATWWCGQAAERAYVREHASAMMISPALSTRLPFDPHDTAALGGELHLAGYASVDDMIDRGAEYLVGQEAVTLSTTPSWVDGALVPRPMALRVFLARDGDDWFAMPGGYARIGRGNGVVAMGMHAGGQCADVWVVGSSPVADVGAGKTFVDIVPDAVLSDDGMAAQRDGAGDELPSRAADNLYWLGRYIERAEFYTRLARVHDIRRADSGPAGDSALTGYLEGYLRWLGVETKAPADSAASDGSAGAAALPEAIADTIHAAARCANRLLDRLSPDGLVAITRIQRSLEQRGDGTALAARLGDLLRRMIAFSGLAHESMYRGTAWRFLAAGRAVERAQSTVSLAASLAQPGAPSGAMQAALDCADSRLAHHERFAFGMSCESVLALLCLDRRNPRSLRHQLDELHDHVRALPGAITEGRLSPLMAELLTLHTDVATCTPASLDEAALMSIRARVTALSDRLSATYLA